MTRTYKYTSSNKHVLASKKDFFFVEQEESREMKELIAISALKIQTIFKNPNELLLHNQDSPLHTGVQSDWETQNSQGVCVPAG